MQYRIAFIWNGMTLDFDQAKDFSLTHERTIEVVAVTAEQKEADLFNPEVIPAGTPFPGTACEVWAPCIKFGSPAPATVGLGGGTTVDVASAKIKLEVLAKAIKLAEAVNASQPAMV